MRAEASQRSHWFSGRSRINYNIADNGSALRKRNWNSGLWYVNHGGQYFFGLYNFTDRRRRPQRYRRQFFDLGLG